MNVMEIIGEAPEPAPPAKPPPECSLDDLLEATGWFDVPDPPVSVTTDPEGQVRRILAAVPEANPDYVRGLVSKASDEFIDTLLSIDKRRTRLARDIILRDGIVTRDTLKYSDDGHVLNDRAIRELAEYGLPLSRSTVSGNVLSFTFDPEKFQAPGEARWSIPPKMRAAVIAQYGTCSMCPSQIDLAPDHRVPFARVRNALIRQEGLDALQALCGTHNNRKKSACNRCQEPVERCRECLWAYPEKYTHIAGKPERSVSLTASSPEQFGLLADIAQLARDRGLIVRD